MISVLFATLDAGGNLPPALAIARAVVDAGGTARFLASPAQLERIRAAGFSARAYETAPPIEAAADGNLASISLRQTRVFADRRAGHDLVAEFRRDPADVVLIDCLLLGATDEAVRAGLPAATLVHTTWSFFTAAVRGPMGLLIRARGTDARAALNAPRTKIITAIPDFESDPRGDGLTFVGPLEAIGASAAAPSEPRILVSLSTTTVPGQTALLQRIIDGLDGIAASVLVTTGPALEPRDLRVPKGVTVCRSADHAAEMPAASLVVAHGGHGTTARALVHGVPVLELPAHPLTDQPSIAAAVDRLGVGAALPRRARPSAIREAAERLLADADVRGRAGALGERLRAMDPRAAALRALAAAAATAHVG